MTGPHVRCDMLTVTFLASINLAHYDITIDVSTQKSLLQGVKLCANSSYKIHAENPKIIEY